MQKQVLAVKEPSENIPVLNGVRALAALSVFAAHSTGLYFHGFLFGRGSGQPGVMLFFMLSGFLMGHLYLKRPPGHGDILEFAVKRISRVYPMFALVVLGTYLAIKLGFQGYAYGMSSAGELFATLGLTHGTSVLWSIGPEIIFYGVFMILWPLWHRNRVAFFAVLTPLLFVAWLPIDIQPTNSIFALHDRLPYFVIGTFLGFHSDRLQGRIAMPFFWVALASYIFGSPQIADLVLSVPERMATDPWSFPLYIGTTISLLVTAILARPWLLTNPIAVYLGRISFSFYLIHFLVLVNLQSLFPDKPLLAVCTSLAVCICFSSACYHFIESPARAAARSWLGISDAPRRQYGKLAS